MQKATARSVRTRWKLVIPLVVLGGFAVLISVSLRNAVQLPRRAGAGTTLGPAPMAVTEDSGLALTADLSSRTLAAGSRVLITLTLTNHDRQPRVIQPGWLPYAARLRFFDQSRMPIDPRLVGPVGTLDRDALAKTVTLAPGAKYSHAIPLLVGSKADWPNTPLPSTGFWALWGVPSQRIPLADGVHYLRIEVPVGQTDAGASLVARTDLFELECVSPQLESHDHRGPSPARE